jgi:hypothetical protein
MMTVPPFNPGDDLTREFLDTLSGAIRELQGLAVTGVQYPIQRSGGTLSAVLPAQVLVRNDSGGDLEAFTVLGVDGPLFDPDDDEPNFKRHVMVKGVTPAIDDHPGQFVILLAPIKADAVGPAVAAGVCQVKIDVADEDTERHFAEIDDGVTDNLKAVHCGSAAILWRAGGAGVQWAIVRLGKRAIPQPFPVTLTQSGGSQGDETTTATWTYDVTDPATDESLATGVDPVSSPHQWQRPGVGQMIPATFGYAHYDKDDELVLGWINEIVDQEACQEDTGY